MKNTRILVTVLSAAVLLTCTLASGNRGRKEDSYVRLVSADEARQYVQWGTNYRKVKGDARFFHNNTYLLCDSALWNVDSRYIEAYGNVRIIQDRTQLRSDNLYYDIDENTARFSGGVVELEDKDGNRLRTRRLEYNTRDSVATFFNGAALMSQDGKVIESLKGNYDAKVSTFTFEKEVEIYMDSIFMKMDNVVYLANEDKAVFGSNTRTWRGNGFIASQGGSYSRPDSLLCYREDVYMFDPDYEAWAEEVDYRMRVGEIEMRDQVKVLDTADKMIILANHALYEQDSSRATLTENPAVVYFGENEKHEVDTVYVGADTLQYFTVYKFEYSQEEQNAAVKHREDLMFDAITTLREKQAEARAKKYEEDMRASGKLPPLGSAADSLAKAKALADSLAALGIVPGAIVPGADSTGTVPGMTDGDSTGVQPGVIAGEPAGVQTGITVGDSTKTVIPDPIGNPGDMLRENGLNRTVEKTVEDDKTTEPGKTDDNGNTDDANKTATDSTATATVDSTVLRRLRAWNNVKLYRADTQAACDSLEFTERDSIAVLYGRPILWNAVRNQLTSETMHLLLKDGQLHRASMQTDARITSQQDEQYFNQIKSTEMLSYFRDNDLYRFDALGGVTAIFYMVSHERVANVNLKEAKQMTALIKDGTARRLFYLEETKSDAYPVLELPADRHRLKGFEWRAEERPQSPEDITSMSLPESGRDLGLDATKPRYRETNLYFDNYMKDICKKLLPPDKPRNTHPKVQKTRPVNIGSNDDDEEVVPVPIRDEIDMEPETVNDQEVPEVLSYQTPMGELIVKPLGHASIMMEVAGKRIYVDPYGEKTDFSSFEPAGLVLITHSHSDHYDPQVLDMLVTDETVIVAPPDIEDERGICHHMANGEGWVYEGIGIRAVPAYNVEHVRENGQLFHPEGFGNGYVLDLAGFRIYIAGDTEPIPEMDELTDVIDLAFLPKNLPYTMSDEQFVEAANRIRPKYLIPYHFFEIDNDALRRMIDPEIHLIRR